MKQHNIRSYVLRQGRMSAAKQQSYKELMPLYSIPYAPSMGTGLNVFPKKQTLILEIGFGMGHATIEIARKNPHNNYLGIDVHSPGVAAVLRQIDELELKNLRIIQHNAVEVLRDMLPNGSLSGVHIFFPDPWPKKRHFKRRLIQEPFLRILLPRVISGGYVYIVTDWDNYADWILEECAKTRALSLEPRRTPERPRTSFENKARDQGRNIHELFFVRQ